LTRAASFSLAVLPLAAAAAALGVVRERWGLREEREEKTEEGDFAFFFFKGKIGIAGFFCFGIVAPK
jgi:hypothetical protein